ncbi:MAG TPA: hypothetical protein VGJ60_06665 [Chloroflexota bacterium]
MSDSEMVQLPVGVAQPQHEPRCAEIACDADNRAVDGSMAFDLDPVTPTTCHVGPVDALGDHPFEAGYLEPGLSHLDVKSLGHELEARMARCEQSLKQASSLRKGPGLEFIARQFEYVEDKQDRRPRRDSFGEEPSSERQTLLQRPKVGLAALVSDDDLAVNQRFAR